MIVLIGASIHRQNVKKWRATSLCWPQSDKVSRSSQCMSLFCLVVQQRNVRKFANSELRGLCAFKWHAHARTCAWAQNAARLELSSSRCNVPTSLWRLLHSCFLYTFKSHITWAIVVAYNVLESWQTKILTVLRLQYSNARFGRTQRSAHVKVRSLRPHVLLGVKLCRLPNISSPFSCIFLLIRPFSGSFVPFRSAIWRLPLFHSSSLGFAPSVWLANKWPSFSWIVNEWTPKTPAVWLIGFCPRTKCATSESFSSSLYISPTCMCAHTNSRNR